MTIPTALGLPPDDLEGFPEHVASGVWHRLSSKPGPWHFSSESPTSLRGGRFDLASPRGSCYWASNLDGALGEVTQRVPHSVVTRQRLQALYHHRVEPRSPRGVADLASARSRRFGVNGEIHTTLDYVVTRAWARELAGRGWPGLRYGLRSDPSRRAHGLALFGRTGLAVTPRGYGGARTRRLDVADAERRLVKWGVEVLPIPDRVPIRRVR